MTQKTISLSEEAYYKLKKEKNENESFSHEILRILEKRDNSDILDLAGSFKENSDEWGIIEKTIYNNRLNDVSLDREIVED
ncbi:MAG: antitoxin VapB family protein [Promethearchaeota archaeon]